MTHEMKITVCNDRLIILFNPALLLVGGLREWPSWADKLRIERMTDLIIDWNDEAMWTCVTESVGTPTYLIAFPIISKSKRTFSNRFKKWALETLGEEGAESVESFVHDMASDLSEDEIMKKMDDEPGYYGEFQHWIFNNPCHSRTDMSEQEYTSEELIEIAHNITTGPEGIA